MFGKCLESFRGETILESDRLEFDFVLSYQLCDLGKVSVPLCASFFSQGFVRIKRDSWHYA